MKPTTITIIILIFLLTISGLVIKTNINTIDRMSANIESMTLDSNTHIAVTKSELKRLQLYKRELDSLKIAPRKVKRITETVIEIKTDTLKLEKIKEVVKYEDKDYSQYTKNIGCFEVSVLATDEPILMPIEFDINVKQYEYYQRKKILWLPIGKKYLETKLVSNCGNVKSEVIEVVK